MADRGEALFDAPYDQLAHRSLDPSRDKHQLDRSVEACRRSRIRAAAHSRIRQHTSSVSARRRTKDEPCQHGGGDANGHSLGCYEGIVGVDNSAVVAEAPIEPTLAPLVLGRTARRRIT
jgi:hypothetical protein